MKEAGSRDTSLANGYGHWLRAPNRAGVQVEVMWRELAVAGGWAAALCCDSQLREWAPHLDHGRVDVHQPPLVQLPECHRCEEPARGAAGRAGGGVDSWRASGEADSSKPDSHVILAAQWLQVRLCVPRDASATQWASGGSGKFI